MFTRNGDVELFYEVSGDERGEPLLLINGFGSQCVSWPDGLVRTFGDAGYRVVRFDNRDVGLSSKTQGTAPTPGPNLVRDAAYTLFDMAADAVAVLDALDIAQAHVWGVSMGGMIVQAFAIAHPDRAHTITSVMSTTGAPNVGQATPEAMAALTKPLPADRSAFIAQEIESSRAICGPEFDEVFARGRAERSYDRCYWPQGRAWQMAAIIATGDRTDALRSVAIPTTVVHGRVDPLVTLSGGEATAAAIPQARLVVLDRMGHDLPKRYWPDYRAELDALVGRSRDGRRVAAGDELQQ